MSMLLPGLVFILLSSVQGLLAGYVVHNITLEGPNTPLVFSSLPFLIHTPTITPITRANGDHGTKAQSLVNNLLRRGGLLNKGVQSSVTPSAPNQAKTQEYLSNSSNPIPPQPSHPTQVLKKSSESKGRADFSPSTREQGHKPSTLTPTTRSVHNAMITLGTRKHIKGLNDTMEYLANDSGNSNLDLDELERFLHIKLPDMTKPLIYYRTNNSTKENVEQTNRNATGNRNKTTGITQTNTNEENTMAKLKDKGRKEALLCVTKCPHTVVSIEMDIEEQRRICTGILLEENYVMTSGTCIPPDWRPWFATHPGRIFVRSLGDTFTIKTKKVRIYSDSAEKAWTQSADIIILQVETTGSVVRSSFDPSRMYVEESECYLYVYKDKADTSITSFSSARQGRQYDAYYYEQDYEDANARPLDLIKLRIDNLILKPNHTLLGINTSQLLFSIYRKRFNYTTGVVFCDNSFDSLLFSSLHAPPPNQPVTILVLFDLYAMFYHLNRFIYDFSAPMMQLSPRDYLNVDEGGQGGGARPGGLDPLLLGFLACLWCV